jgi:hypothetical protein
MSEFGKMRNAERRNGGVEKMDKSREVEKRSGDAEMSKDRGQSQKGCGKISECGKAEFRVGNVGVQRQSGEVGSSEMWKRGCRKVEKSGIGGIKDR